MQRASSMLSIALLSTSTSTQILLLVEIPTSKLATTLAQTTPKLVLLRSRGTFLSMAIFQ
jgi:hypothetical protein